MSRMGRSVRRYTPRRRPPAADDVEVDLRRRLSAARRALLETTSALPPDHPHRRRLSKAQSPAERLAAYEATLRQIGELARYTALVERQS